MALLLASPTSTCTAWWCLPVPQGVRLKAAKKVCQGAASAAGRVGFRADWHCDSGRLPGVRSDCNQLQSTKLQAPEHDVPSSSHSRAVACAEMNDLGTPDAAINSPGSEHEGITACLPHLIRLVAGLEAGRVDEHLQAELDEHVVEMPL